MTKTWVLIPVICFSGLTPMWGSEPSTAAARPGAESLTFKIEVGQTRYSLYEPVLLTYSVTNPTPEPIESQANLSSLHQGLTVLVVRPTGNPFQVITPSVTDCSIRVAGPTVHPPGETFLSTDDLLWNDDSRPRTGGLTFATPGKYTIEAEFFVGPPTGSLKAKPLEIEVDEPSAIDRAAIASVGSPETLVTILKGAGSYCAGQRGAEEECYTRMRKFVNEFHASAYAPAITADLADWLLLDAGRKGEQAHDRESIEAYHADVQVVLDLTDDFLRRSPDHPEAARIHWTQVMALDRMGSYPKVRDSLVQFMKKYPERRRQFEPLRQKLNIPLPDEVADAPR
jgi:hypothetical protein